MPDRPSLITADDAASAPSLSSERTEQRICGRLPPPRRRRRAEIGVKHVERGMEAGRHPFPAAG